MRARPVLLPCPNPCAAIRLAPPPCNSHRSSPVFLSRAFSSQPWSTIGSGAAAASLPADATAQDEEDSDGEDDTPLSQLPLNVPLFPELTVQGAAILNSLPAAKPVTDPAAKPVANPVAKPVANPVAMSCKPASGKGLTKAAKATKAAEQASRAARDAVQLDDFLDDYTPPVPFQGKKTMPTNIKPAEKPVKPVKAPARRRPNLEGARCC